MEHSPSLPKKTAIRSKLIFACLAVSILISAIYVTVSYRLTSDVNMQAEMKSMQLLLSLIGREVSDSVPIKEERLKAIKNLISESETAAFVNVGRTEEQFTITHNFDEQLVKELVAIIGREHLAGHTNEPVITLGDKSYLWDVASENGATIVYARETALLDAALYTVAKRLFITTVIVFWIAVWLALTLSSIIAKRADEINEALTRLATHDSLTGLPNSFYLKELLAHFANTHKDSGPSNQACLFAIDLDKFKDVNDAFGHSAGDQLLITLSYRISEILDKQCELIRIGGDEFIIWAPGFSVEEGKALAKKVINACDTTIPLNGLEVNTGASVGFSHYPSHTDNLESLLSCADTAMYKAKKQRSGWEVYDVQNRISNERDIMLRAELNNAMLEKQLILHFQPKVDIRTGAITGVEGLCRWQHPSLGLLSPYHFIDLIEHSGKVQDFGRYIIQSAMHHASDWRKENINIPIAINLSPYNLLDPTLATYISQLLREFNLPPSAIEIELTENETCINIAHINSALSDIRDLGVEIAIDDFGTGMSSLAYLDNLKANTIKIDKSFISDIDTNRGHRAIVASALTLADTFECKVLAEGVETQSQVDTLLSLGCFYAQGYFYAKPMCERDLKHYIQTTLVQAV